MDVEIRDDDTLHALDLAERAAITLALSIHASLILIDERKGTRAAISKGLEATGTLGVLSLAARRGMITLADAFARLEQTNSRYWQEILE